MTSSDDRELREALENAQAALKHARAENERLSAELDARQNLQLQLESAERELADAKAREGNLVDALMRAKSQPVTASTVDVQLDALREEERARRPNPRKVFTWIALMVMLALGGLAFSLGELIDHSILAAVGVFVVVMIAIVNAVKFTRE